MKEKTFDFKKWIWIGAVPTVFGAIVLCSKTIIAYAEMPQKVAKIEQYIEAQQRSNEIQQQANDLMQQIITKEKESDPIIFSPDKKKFWNIEKQEWRSVKELESK